VRLAHLSLAVADQERSRRFYETDGYQLEVFCCE